MTQERTSGALTGIRVLDLTDEKGQWCGKFLADLGADVVKIEPPGGDPVRLKGPFYHDIPDKEKSLTWLGANAGKRGITLNIEKEAGQELLKKLVKKADLVIESFMPGYLGRIGLGYDVLSGVNPRLVLTSITPFGQTGPYASYRGYDLTLTAMSGYMFPCGDADRPPVRISIEQSYLAAGVQSASASLMALRYSSRTGKGQHVDVAIRECLPSGGFEIYFWEVDGSVGERMGMRRRRANIFLRDLWPCKDGYIGWRLLVGPLGADTLYKLVAWMDQEGAAGELKDVKWESLDMTELSQEQLEHWENIFIPFFKTHTKEEIYQVALKNGMLMAPSYNAKELLSYSQLLARDFWHRVPAPEPDGEIVFPGAFCKMSATPVLAPRPAPRLGEHNIDIYTNELGLSRQALAKLTKQGVI